MVGNVAVQTQSAEPPIGQIEVDLLAQPPLGANPKAVADEQYPHHQLRINRGASNVAVIGLEMRPNAGKVDETVDPAQHVIIRDVPFQAEAVEQRLLHHPPLAHHRPNLLPLGEGNQRRTRQSSEFFNKIGRTMPFDLSPAKVRSRSRGAAIPVSAHLGRSGGGGEGRLCV